MISTYLNLEEPNRSCLLALRHIILGLDEGVSETKKYGMPCFTYYNKIVCYLWIDKKINEPYILFVEGRYLNHKALETGNRSRMKIFRVNPKADLPLQTINMLLNQALDLYRK